MALDLRPFLHAESLQILPIPRLLLVDSPPQLIPQIFFGVLVGGLWRPRQKLYSVIREPFLCGFWGGLRIVTLLEGPTMAHFNLPEAVLFLFNIFWYLMESKVPFILTRCPGPMKEKQPHKIKDPPPYFTVCGASLYDDLSFYAKPTSDVCCQKALCWSYLTIWRGPTESPSNV